MKNHPNFNAIMECLHKIFQDEMAGIIRYLHYSFMIMGHNRIPIQKWLRDRADESKMHAIAIGEKITSLEGHPPVVTTKIEETNMHNVDQLLKESLVFEEQALEHYRDLAKLAQGDIALEDFAREFVRKETEHVDEVRKMLRKEK
jgi:bacterioferritin